MAGLEPRVIAIRPPPPGKAKALAEARAAKVERRATRKMAAALKPVSASSSRHEDGRLDLREFAETRWRLRELWEPMSEDEREAFDQRLRSCLVGDLSPAEWQATLRLLREVRAVYEPPAGRTRTRAKDRWHPPPQGW
jgi:hypothetical protein